LTDGTAPGPGRYMQHFMKHFYTLVFLFLTLTAFGQIEKHKFLTTGTFRLRNYYEGGNEYKRVQVGFTNKTGFFVTNSIAIGSQVDYTWTHEKVKRWSMLQQGNSQWYQKGIYNRQEYSIGLFVDKYFKLAKKLYATAGMYAQYYSFKDVEEGQIFDQNDTYVGVDYKSLTYPNQIAKVGLTNSAVYFLNARFGINCLLSSLDIVINKNKASEFDMKFPIMNLGIQYHFPK